MEEARYVELAARYLSGEIDSKDKAELLAWAEGSPANRKFFDQLIELWSLSGRFDEGDDFEPDLGQAWAKLEQKLPDGEARIRKITGLGWMLRIAATLTLLLVASYWIFGPRKASFETVATLTEEQKEITLPDGSRVWINQDSKIAFDPAFRTREVHLEGEAFFEVVRDEHRPFVVLSGGAQTTVLGTKFNVRAYPQEEKVEVTVESGKVAVDPATKSGEGVKLEAGNSGVYLKAENKVELEEDGIYKAAAWKNRNLLFRDDLLRDAIPAMERYYNVKIIPENPLLLNCHVVSSEEDPKLETLLQIIKFTNGISYEQRGDTILINGPGCQ